MLKNAITLLIQANISVGGVKMKPGQVVKLEDSPYVRILVKSGNVALIDPPSLDMEYLEKAGFELREGHTYPVKPVTMVALENAGFELKEVKEVEKPAEKEVEKPSGNGFLTRVPSRKTIKTDEGHSTQVSKAEISPRPEDVSHKE